MDSHIRMMIRFAATALIAAAIGLATAPDARAQLALGTVFTYQGSLSDGGTAANGTYDFAFDLYAIDTGGISLGTVAADDVTVTRGVFTVTLDFGAQFDGNRRWLAIGVRPGAETGAYTALAPRVELTAAPYAIYAIQAGNAATADNATTADTATNATNAANATNATNAANADLLDGLDSTAFDSDTTNELQTLAEVLAEGNDAGGANAVNLGSIGIGTTGPSVPLEIAPNAGNSALLLRKGDNTVEANLVFMGSGTQFNLGTPQGDRFRIWNDQSGEVFSIDPATGGIGVGVSEPSARLEIGGTPGTDGIMFPDGSLQTEAGGNRPPVAIMDADAIHVTIGPLNDSEVEFDLSLSYDPEGGATTYGFDPEGSTSGEPSYGGSATLVHAYTAAGTYLAEGWVKDAAGQYARDKVLVTVSDASVIPDSSGDVGSFSSLAVVNGNPAISYHDATNGDLKYVRASDAVGAAWGAPRTLDSSGTVGTYTSLAVVNGAPAISYYDSTNSSLKYVRASDASGSTWGAPLTVNNDQAVGRFTTLRVVNGNPAISYYDETNARPKFIRATDASGTAWGSPVTVDTTGTAVGAFSSMAVVNGNPAITYSDFGGAVLRYVRATDANGTAWGTPVGPDASFFSVGFATSLAVVNGNPAISFVDGAETRLRYIRATDADGTTWGSRITLDTAQIDQDSTSLAVIGGSPAVAYFEFGGSDLKYASSSDASGTAWNAARTIDSEGNTGAYPSLAEVGGAAAISYYDETNGDLVYVH